MSIDKKEYIEELNQNYNDLGEDLLMLEAVVLALEGETCFPEEYVASSMERLWEYIDQHTGELKQLAKFLVRRPRHSAPRRRADRSLPIARSRRSRYS